MKDQARAMLDDLRARGLLPVAILLVAAIVAVPVFLLDSGGEDAGETAAVVPPPPATAKAGFQLEVAEPRSSDLESFSASDPFAPKGGRGGGASASAASVNVVEEEGAGTGGQSDGGGGSGGDAPAPAPQPDHGGSGDGGDDGDETVRRSFVYTLDLTFQSPAGERRYRNLERLTMLPSTASPLIVHLGVTAEGGSARFLVDATVVLLEGEGACTPSREACATIALEPGEQQAFADADGQRYLIRVDQIRERRVSAADAGAGDAGGARQSGAVQRRFELPPLVDVVTEEVQR